MNGAFRRGGLLLGGLALAIAGCDRPEATDSGPLVLYGGIPNGDDGLIVGTLALDAGCLYVDAPPSQGRLDRFLLVLPTRGTRWEAPAQAVHRSNGKPLVVGQEVSLGGGGGAPFPGWLDGLAVPPGATCDQSLVWVTDAG